MDLKVFLSVMDVDKKETEKVVREKLANTVKLEKIIIKQLEFYFGDSNLPFDKFLRSITETNGGWVRIDLLMTFPRMSSLTEDPAVVVSVVKNAKESILEVDDQLEHIRRKTHLVLPVDIQKHLSDMIDLSIYCKGFPKTATNDEILNYFARYGDDVIKKITFRRYKNKQFRGTIYVTFYTIDQAQIFLKHKNVKFNGVLLKRMWQRDFQRQKDLEYQKQQAKKRRKLKEPIIKNIFPKGYLLQTDCKNLSVINIKYICAKLNWRVEFVNIVGDTAFIRLKRIVPAKDLLDKIANIKHHLPINFSIPDEDTEKTMLVKMEEGLRSVFKRRREYALINKLKRHGSYFIRKPVKKPKNPKRSNEETDDDKPSKKIKIA